MEESSDPVYYRIYFSDGEITICCLQSFDESRYDKRKWLTKQRFDDEEAAIEFLIQAQSSQPDLPLELRQALNRFLAQTGASYTNIFDRT